MRVLSVDLGTSNTVAVLSAHGRPPQVVEVDGSPSMPSSVFAEEGGQLVVGRDAQRQARLDPTRFEPNPKRRVDEQSLLLGDDVVPVNEALAAVLRRVLDETTRQLGGLHPDQVRLTHPAQWGPVRCNVLLSAARLAGLGDAVAMVPEPVAAAAHFASSSGKNLAPGQALALYDLGAGTFDVAVVGAAQRGYTVLAEDGLPDLGGLDVDQAMLVHVGREVSHRDPQQWQRLLRPESTADRRGRRALQEDVRGAKEALSRHPQTEVPMPEPFTDVLVTRDELEGLVRPAMLRSVELLSNTLRNAGMTAANLVGVYLVGGSSRLPLVGSMISEKLGVVPSSLDQPETAVAYGAHHVAADGISTRTQQLDDRTAANGGPSPRAAPGGAPGSPTVANIPPVPGPGPRAGGGQPSGYAPPGSGATGGFAPRAAPGFPGYPAGSAAPGPGGSGGNRGNGGNRVRGGKRKKLLVGGVAAAVVVLLGLGGVFYFITVSGSVPTYAAGECAEPGNPDSDGFTGCMRQLAGDIADDDQCESGTGSGPAAAGDDLGATVTCPAPGLSGGQVTYVHGESSESVENYMVRLLNAIGGDEQIRAKWQGNALTGKYVSESGGRSAVLAFRAADRPVAGFIYQVDSDGSRDMKPATELGDYFEHRIQPGT